MRRALSGLVLAALAACAGDRARGTSPVSAPVPGPSPSDAEDAGAARPEDAHPTSAPAQHDAGASPDASPPPAAPEPPPPDATTIASNAGTYQVSYRATPPIERGEPFALDVWVRNADPRAPLDDLALSVDAAMPSHGHGMNRVPKVEKLGPGRFHVEGLLFHMAGPWELYLDVARGPLVERAQAALELE